MFSKTVLVSHLIYMTIKLKIIINALNHIIFRNLLTVLKIPEVTLS